MKERPIIMRAEEVRAILDGRKTQARRIVKPQSAVLTDEMARTLGVQPPKTQNPPVIPCPFGQPGDRLWVKETCAFHYMDGDGSHPLYRADLTPKSAPPEGYDFWIPSAQMPRWASRILLEVMAVRVERLQDISETDAVAEGLIRYGEGFRYAPDFPWFANPVAAFRSGWDKKSRPLHGLAIGGYG